MDRLMSECRVVGRMMCLTFRSGEEVLERISVFGEVAERSCMNHYSDISYAVALPRVPSPCTWSALRAARVPYVLAGRR